jgi:ketol-acid reductoisomerase
LPTAPVDAISDDDMSDEKAIRKQFEEADAAPDALQGLRVAILGYGNQGHAHALNLRDSGVDVVVGLRETSSKATAARGAGFEIGSFSQASRGADIVMVLLPDEVQAEIVTTEVLPHMRPDAHLAFAHGFVLSAGLLELPSERAAFLVAPKGQGHKLREAFRSGGGLPSLIAIRGPRPDETLRLALGYAHACGALRGGATLSSFREEAVTDQFGEQAVLCGGLVELITAAWETLVDRGYSPEVAYFECLHEVKLITDLIHAYGVDGMREMISSTAAFGGLRAGRRVIGSESRDAMKQLLDEIEDGRFAQEFLSKQNEHSKEMAEAVQAERAHPMQDTGRSLRAFLDRCQLGAAASDSSEDGSH